MKIKIELMCWVKGQPEAEEVVTLSEDEILDALRGASGPVFKTPIEKQDHWELRKVEFE